MIGYLGPAVLAALFFTMPRREFMTSLLIGTGIALLIQIAYLTGNPQDFYP